MLVDVQLLLIPLCLVLAAIFAAAEASLFSLSRTQLEGLRETRPGKYRKIQTLLFEPEKLLSTLIIGNEFINILIGTFVVGILERTHYFSSRGLAIASVLISTTLLLTFSEVLPKVLAFRIPVLTASVLVELVTIINYALAPLRKIFLFVSSQVTRALGVRPEPPKAMTEKDFIELIEVGADSGSLEKEEKDRIINVFHFSDLPVSAVMTPWEKVFSIQDNLPLNEVLEAVKKRPLSRIPVLSFRSGFVVGILYTKELLNFILDQGGASRTDAIKEAMFPPYIVSSHKRVARLFREFKQKKVHMALVVDEFGKHLGVVTLEDVLNALFKTQRPKAEGAKP